MGTGAGDEGRGARAGMARVGRTRVTRARNLCCEALVVGLASLRAAEVTLGGQKRRRTVARPAVKTAVKTDVCRAGARLQVGGICERRDAKGASADKTSGARLPSTQSRPECGPMRSAQGQASGARLQVGDKCERKDDTASRGGLSSAKKSAPAGRSAAPCARVGPAAAPPPGLPA